MRPTATQALEEICVVEGIDHSVVFDIVRVRDEVDDIPGRIAPETECAIAVDGTGLVPTVVAEHDGARFMVDELETWLWVRVSIPSRLPP